MKRPKRRYTSPNQIEVEIAAVQQNAKDLLHSADSLETISREHFKLAAQQGNEWFREQGRHELEQARKNCVTATNLLEEKLKYLSAKLAEINTQPIPGLLTDTSVEV